MAFERAAAQEREKKRDAVRMKRIKDALDKLLVTMNQTNTGIVEEVVRDVFLNADRLTIASGIELHELLGKILAKEKAEVA